MKHMDSAGILRAGIGKSLDEAAAAVTIPTQEGDVAYIAATATYWENDSLRAGYAHEEIPARPGVNGLRHIDECLITPSEMAYVKDLAQRTLVNAEEEMESLLGYGRADDGTFTFGTVKFRVSDHTGRWSRVHETDMQRIENEIRKAKKRHTYCVVSLHSHQFKARAEHETDYYVEEFAHRCIDAGADAIVGTGTHIPKAVEIYKGKPIFYCVGNFVFQVLYAKRVTADCLEKKGYPYDMTAQEYIARRRQNATQSMEDVPIYYMGIVPRWEMKDGKVTKIELLPIELGMQEPMGRRGFPSPMAPERLMDHMKMVCDPYGTKLNIRGNVIEVVTE
jgi:poly-gamma-glutamate synthesis protein (capsule biosynthesis protein)